MIRGYYVNSGSSATKVSVATYCSIDPDNANTLWCQLYNLDNANYYYFYLAIEVVIVHLQTMKTDFNGRVIDIIYKSVTAAGSYDLSRVVYD